MTSGVGAVTTTWPASGGVEAAWRSRTCLVTGAAGFIGSHLVDALLAAECRVIGVDSFCDYYDPAAKRANLASATRHPRFSLLEADLVRLELEPLVSDVDAVFHLAGQPGVRASWGPSFATYLEANVLVTQRLLEALTHRAVPTVFSSSSSVYGEGADSPRSEDDPLRPVSPYGLTKSTAEQLIDVYRRDSGLSVVSLRYFSVFGPRQRPDMAFHRFIVAAETETALNVFGDGEQSRDFTYVGDVVDATMRALGAPSTLYNVGGGTPATVNEVLAQVATLTGRSLHVVHDARARGDVNRTWADTTRLRAELNWSPTTTLAQGLAAQIEHYRRSDRSNDFVA